MPHVSRKKLSPKTLQQILNSLVFVLTETRNKEQMAQLLEALLSDTERVMLAKRIAVVYLLSEGIEGDVIAKTLNVTPFTVSRIKLWYETKGEGYKVAIGELKKQKYLEALKFLALKLATHLVKSARYGFG